MFFLLFHRLLRPRIVLAILALGPGAMFGQSVAGTLPEDYLPGLKAILTDALNLAPRMLDQRIALAQADVDKMAANSALYPRLTGGAGYGVSSARSASATSSSSSSSSGFTYGLTLSQPLFQEGAIKAQSDIAKLGQQIAQKNYQAAYLSLASTLRYQYLQLVVKKAMLTHLLPIIAVGAFSLAIIVERSMALFWKFPIDSHSFVTEVKQKVLSNDIAGAIQHCSNQGNALPARVAKAGLLGLKALQHGEIALGARVPAPPVHRRQPVLPPAPHDGEHEHRPRHPDHLKYGLVARIVAAAEYDRRLTAFFSQMEVPTTAS